MDTAPSPSDYPVSPPSAASAELLVGVCTCRRPKMLRACLASLMRQVQPDDCRVTILVIDNEPGAPAGWIVAEFAELSPFPVRYAHQPAPGIAAARNMVLDIADAMSANWIAFIDDDEVAEPDWLAELMAPAYRHVPVLAGLNVAVYPRPLPFWAGEQAPGGREGDALKTAYTGNVRFSAALLARGLRFDERLGFMGGEDNEFFARAHAMGFGIKRTLRAVTRETILPQRLTYRAQTYRAYWCAASELRRLMISRGWIGAAMRKAHTVPLNLIIGAGWLIASPLALAGGVEAFRDAALTGGKRIAKALGRAAALAGIQPQPYRTTTGE
jgi:succinoglycan biosynthesis protein ExoM